MPVFIDSEGGNMEDKDTVCPHCKDIIEKSVRDKEIDEENRKKKGGLGGVCDI